MARFFAAAVVVALGLSSAGALGAAPSKDLTGETVPHGPKGPKVVVSCSCQVCNQSYLGKFSCQTHTWTVVAPASCSSKRPSVCT